MMYYNYPLLLTATIEPQSLKLLVLTDPQERYKQYIKVLLQYIFHSDLNEFVFCENSMYDLSCIYAIKDIASHIGKKIEILQFPGDVSKTERFTRAYGDQEIMEYAVQHSQLIKDAGGFYKATGRYWIKNINHILEAWRDKKTVFVKGGLCGRTVHTAFFKTSIPYFETHFYGKAEQLGKFTNSLEYLYYYYIKQSGIKMCVSGVHPHFVAERGSGGRMDESWIMRIKTNIFAKLGVYNIN